MILWAELVDSIHNSTYCGKTRLGNVSGAFDGSDSGKEIGGGITAHDLHRQRYDS